MEGDALRLVTTCRCRIFAEVTAPNETAAKAKTTAVAEMRIFTGAKARWRLAVRGLVFMG